MRCSKCRKLLVEFSEGRLKGKLDEDVWDHIADCAACRRELDGFQSSLELMDAVMRVERVPKTPTDLAERIMERIHRDAKPRIAFRRLAFGVIVSFCLIVLGTLFLPSRLAERQEQFSALNDTGRMPALPESARMELARLLGQAVEIIERGEQQWEIEI
jgi:predicted anti-sigma-YlaC factor YlaD